MSDQAQWDAKEKWIEGFALDLQEGWRKYRAGFGEDPHGTLPQIRALLSLTKMPGEKR